jgi:cytochrome c2
MSGKRIPLLAAALLAAALGAVHARGRTAPPAAAPTASDDAEKPAGLQVTFRSLAKEAGGAADTRPARLVALYVPAGDPVTPFLPPGPFRATWTASLAAGLGGETTFSAEGRGKLTVLVGGKPVLEASGDDFRKAAGKPTELQDANALEVRYESPAAGDAFVRLFWGSGDFRREPLAPTAVRYDDKAHEVQAGRRRRAGRELVATLRCTRCHAADTAAWLKAGGMPELEADAPSLAEVGARLRPGWVARWVQDPHALRPSATMPRVFPDAGRGLQAKPDARARDVAAYLATLGKADERAEPAAKEEEVAAGTRLFATLGCVGCHTAPTRDDFADDGRLPLRDVGAKWRPAALRDFLRQPDRHYAWVRMPNFHLTADEAARLAAYLLSPKPRDLGGDADAPAADAGRGRKLVETSGCLNCHSLEKDKAPAGKSAAPAFAALGKEECERGCMSPKPIPGGKAPEFVLTAEQRAALADFLASGKASLARDTAAEFAARQLTALRCFACHKRDGADDHWTEVKDEAEGLVSGLPDPGPDKDGQQYPAEQVRPTLTWAGEKLKPEWTAAFLAGKVPYKPRPYLRARMPAFPRRAELLARGLAFEHGCPPRSEPPPEADRKLAEVGRNLASKARWGCAGCHDIGSAAAVGVFEAPGVNFRHARERLRHEYFLRWLWGPTRVEPGTKMPTVFNFGQPSAIGDVLGGDADKQIDALWQYLLLGDKITPPES